MGVRVYSSKVRVIMICNACKVAADNDRPDIHEYCQGNKHCDCQHKKIGDPDNGQGSTQQQSKEGTRSS